MDGTVYALKAADKKAVGKKYIDVTPALLHGEGRFGWSYVKTADLRKLQDRIKRKGWDSLSEDEQACYQDFLLEFKEDDYVIYVNLPDWGKCTVARVTGPYRWRFDERDFNHRFPVDASSIRVFDRNDDMVHPALRTRLKLPGRRWRIDLPTEFRDLLTSLENGIQPTPKTPATSLRLLSNEIQPFLLSITESIQHTHPNYDLEKLIEGVLAKVPRVTSVKRQGGAGDHGADILVTFESGLSIPGLAARGVSLDSFCRA